MKKLMVRYNDNLKWVYVCGLTKIGGSNHCISSAQPPHHDTHTPTLQECIDALPDFEFKEVDQ